MLVAGLSLVAITACSSSNDNSSAAAGSSPPAAGATGSAASVATGDTGTTITTAFPTDISSLDPANLSTPQDYAIVRNIYQPLLSPAFVEQQDGSLKFDGAKVKPLLAESWTTGDNSITFKLRQGVKFYGTDDTVTAEDVKFSLGRIWETPGVGDLQANGLQDPSDIHVVDDQTVEIDFKSPDGTPTPVTPTLLAIFDQPYTSIISEDLVKPHITTDDPTGKEWLRANTAGTGPYYLASRQPGVNLVLKAIPDAWTPQPAYPTVNIQITSGSVQSLLQNGDINFGEYGMTNQQVNTLEQAGLTVFWQNTGSFDMFAITAGPDDQVGALANPLVRQAMAYAMPYDQILKNVVFGRGAKDESIVSPSAPEFTAAWSKYTTDLDKAKDLMKQAGNPKISVPFHYLGADVDQTNTAIVIKSALSKIGIDTELTPETPAGLFDVVDARSTPASGAAIGPPGVELFNWSAWTDDPKIVIGYWATTGGINNYSLWADPQVDATNKEYALQTTSDARTAAYQQAQTIIADDAPVIPIVATGAVTVTAKGITGVSFTPNGSSRFWTLHPVGSDSAINKLFT